METKEFLVFRSLLSDVHFKAFGEPLSEFRLSKIQLLCQMIHDTTGELIDDKTLSTYITAAQQGDMFVNPCPAILAALAKYVAGDEIYHGRHAMRMGDYAHWYKYRSSVLAARAMAA